MRAESALLTIAICFLIFVMIVDIGLVMDRKILNSRVNAQILATQRAQAQTRILGNIIVKIKACKKMNEVQEILEKK